MNDHISVPTGSPGGVVVRWLMAAVALCLILQAWLAVTLEINWDEFFYLSHLYDYQRGELRKALQSLHVHLLGWVTSLPGNEVDQVTAGRFVMLAFLTGTCALIYKLARTFFSPAASAIAVLAFASAGPTIVHGMSFRADPITAAFIMLSLVTLARGKASPGPMLLAGASAAIAAMITIKVALYAPAFLGIAAWRLRDKDQRSKEMKWLAGTAAVAGTAFAALYFLQLSLIEKASNAGSQAMLGNAAQNTLLAPKWDFVSSAAKISTIQTIFLIAGAIGVLAAFFRASATERFRLFAIAGCGATLLCLLFYRNVFPYFFPFILPPAMLLVAWAAEWIVRLRRSLWLGVAGAAFLLPALMVGASWLLFRERPPQRQIVDAVHRIFPDPVPMIDQSHTIASFPKRGFFMSTWGVARYRRGRPIFADILRRETIPLLLIDGPVLAEAVGIYDPNDPTWRADLPLLDEDRAILAQNYVPHWGPIWVAGKRLDPAVSPGRFEILVPGTYTLEGEGLSIDGKPVTSGGIITLARGKHRFDAASPGVRTLRWGRGLPRPSDPEPEGHLFSQFFGWTA